MDNGPRLGSRFNLLLSPGSVPAPLQSGRLVSQIIPPGGPAVSGFRLSEAAVAPEEREGGETDMCEAIQGMIDAAVEKAVINAENNGMKKAYGIMKELQMHTPTAEICRKLQVTEAQVNLVKTEMGL